MRKVRVFKIRLNNLYTIDDEALLNDFLENTSVIEFNSAMINDKLEQFWSVIIYYEEFSEEIHHIDSIIKYKIQYDSSEPLNPEEEELFYAIKIWRDAEAEKLRIVPSMIIHNAHIRTMIKLRVRTTDDMYRVDGLSSRKIELYGENILRIINDNLDKLNWD